MNLGWWSLLVLALAVGVGMIRPKANSGTLALAGLLLLGVGIANMKVKEVISGFPVELFLTLVAVNLFFGMARENGTLPKISNAAMKVLRGERRLMPLGFFGLAFLLSAIGPGNIASVAILAPIVMVMAHEAGVSQFLAAVMLCTGANAGAFSPIAPTGIIGAGLLQKIGISSLTVPWQVFGAAAFMQSLTAFGAYVFLGERETKEGMWREKLKMKNGARSR